MYPGERFNTITHLLGSALAIAGTAALVSAAVVAGGGRRITAVAVYGGMLVVAYVSSTLYHSVRGPAKKVFHVFDHCAIYLLIAGTYTPFTLIALRGAWGWALFAIVWALAIFGVAKDVFLHNRFRALSVVLYLLMGWLIIVAFGPLQKALAPDGVKWLIAGGIVYTSGVIFFALSKKVIHAHGVWHLCVLGGSVCHFVAVIRYVVPIGVSV